MLPFPVLPQAELDLRTYAGLTITGETGKVYSVEYALDAEQPEWRCLEFVQLPYSPYLWVDRSASASDHRFYRAVEFEPLGQLVFIPPGTFRMGSPTNEVGRTEVEGPLTEVVMSRGFWIGKYEVTQGEYESVMGENPSFHNGVRGTVDYGTDLSRPVERVDYGDAASYCVLLTQETLTAARMPANTVYRLPTEAEWEYACRALTSTRFSYGEDLEAQALTDYAWYFGNRGPASGTQSVGQKLPNPWGLYDMHGNVFEWCQDWYAQYPGGRIVDPRGPASSQYRVFRGGGWSFNTQYCRSAHRSFFFPSTVGDALGFRVVLAPARP
jgi:formylglycine-generating enzyme required for sulfatase activity